MPEFNPEEVLNSLKGVLANAKANIADNNGWDLGDIKDVFDAVLLTVGAVEQAVSDFEATGGDKKKLAVDSLNWLIDIPMVPEFMEEKILGLVVDLVVQALNRFKGPDWGDGVEIPTDGEKPVVI